MRKFTFLLFIGILAFSSITFAQLDFHQTIRGRIVDKDSKQPLPGVAVMLMASDSTIGSSSDADGYFRLTNVPIGRQGIQASMVGYKPICIQNLILQTAQETVLEIEMEEGVVLMKEVTVNASGNKQNANNQMATVSARSFTVEETEKFAGSRGDVARMAMNYAGVSAANDSRNDIVIRGNSPSGLLWRLEDMDIPNPNHFAENGTTGGPVGMINNNLLTNSDFFTSAFPAEYGNATSGVFDLKMRNGNNEKYEFLFQSGFNGFEAGAEGPFNKNYKGSFLVNFRYSTLELVDGLVNFGTSGVPKYKDLSFKLNFPLKKGRITVFGLAGKSSIDMLDSKKKDNDLYADDGQDLYNRSKMGATGISFTNIIDSKSYYKITLSTIYSDGGTLIDTLDAGGTPHQYLDHNYGDFRNSLNAYIVQKYSAQFTCREGITIDRMGYDLYTRLYKQEDMGMRTVIKDGKSLFAGPSLVRTYYEATYKVTDAFSLNPGVHFMYFDLNGKYVLEPRIGLSWEFVPGQKLSAGYGLHSQIQSMYTYFIGTHMDDGSLVETNKNLGFTRSHQTVVGYDLRISENTRFKSEVYYQQLFNIPVETRPSSYSLLNTGASWGVEAKDSLVNSGKGSNYGMELTLERFFANNYYFLTTLSLFESKYIGSDGHEYNSAFNGNYVWNALFGREFPLSKKTALTLDLKSTFAGGKRYTPINLNASRAAGETKYIETEANSKQFSPFFKADVKVGLRLNGKRVSQEWQVYVENVTNHQNILMQTYSRAKSDITTTYQLGFFPMMLYRLHF